MRSNILPLIQRSSRFATTSEWEFQLDILAECVAFLDRSAERAEATEKEASSEETAFYREERASVVEEAQEALVVLRALAQSRSRMKS